MQSRKKIQLVLNVMFLPLNAFQAQWEKHIF